MAETIQKVIYHDDLVEDHEEWVGIELQTSHQTIKVFINSTQYCCENYDILMVTPDKQLNPKELKGYTIQKVGWGKQTIHPDYKWIVENNSLFGEDVYYAIVNVETNKGLIQIIAFNNHNGFYPHLVKVSWKDYQDTQKI